MSLRDDVERTEGLQGHFREGLKALKRLDRRRLSVEKPVGSVDIDGALSELHPSAPRWDYLIGQRSSATRILLHLVEVHSADGEHNIGEVERKFIWLTAWIGGTRLNSYQKKFYWVSSGKCSLTSLYPRVKALAQRGVSFGGKHLSIGCREL